MGKKTTLLVIFFSILFGSTLFADELCVRHASGGRPASLEVYGDYWYQSLGDKLVVNKKFGDGQVATQMLTSFPAEGICTDLLIDGSTLYALIDSHEVVVLSLTRPDVPVVVERLSLEQLGIAPRALGFVGGWPVAMGYGGVIRLSDRRLLIETETDVSSCVMSMNRGMLFTQNGFLFDANAREKINSLDKIFAINESANANLGSLIALRDKAGGTELELLNRDLSPVNNNLGKTMLQGQKQSLAIYGSRVIVSTTECLYVVGIAPDELRILKKIDLPNVLDAEVLSSNYLAVCGDFGHGVLRLEDDRGGKGGELLRVVPAFTQLEAGEYDHRGIQVPSGKASVYYSFDHGYSVSQSPAVSIEAPQEAVVLGLSAEVNLDGDVIVHNSVGVSSTLVLKSKATTIIPNAGNFWVGTQDGIFVFGRNTSGDCEELGSIDLAGPIVQLVPLFDGAVAFVSKHGTIGIIERSQDIAFEQ